MNVPSQVAGARPVEYPANPAWVKPYQVLPDTGHLPVAQPTGGALAYPQGLPVGMPPMEELDGGGGFSIMGLVHSLRRQLIPALGLGLVVASLIALALWFVIPVTYTAEAVLRVNRDLSKDRFYPSRDRNHRAKGFSKRTFN